VAFRTKRRKPRVTWLPIFGETATVAGEGGGTNQAGGLTFSVLHTDADAGIIYDAAPLTFDSPGSPAAQQDLGLETRTLQDFVQGTTYRLRRIVGKAFCAVARADGADPTDIWAVDCAFGFMVCRVDDTGAPQTDFGEVNPLFQDSMEDPWIWRRRWILGTGTSALTASNDLVPLSRMPPNNCVGYGSVMDGPHIDTKVARVIGVQERLFGVFASRVIASADPITQPVFTQLFLDYRILASMRANQGNKRNASR